MPRGDVGQHQADYYSSYIGPTQVVTVDGTSRASALLVPGHYLIYCDEASVYLRQGSAADVVTAGDYYLRRGFYRDLTVDDEQNGILYVTTADGAGGKLRITRISGSTGSEAQHQADFFSSYIGSTQTVVVDGTSRGSTLLAPGHYIIFCEETAVFLRQGDALASVSDNDFLLRQMYYRDLTVDDASTGYVYVTSADGVSTGNLRITRISDET